MANPLQAHVLIITKHQQPEKKQSSLQGRSLSLGNFCLRTSEKTVGFWESTRVSNKRLLMGEVPKTEKKHHG